MNDLQFGDFTLDLQARQLFRGTDRVPLPGKAFELLAYMARNPGVVLSKSDLLAQVWQGAFVEEANLSQTVFLIRKALGPEGDRIVVTLPRVGYRFSEAVSERLPKTAAPVTEPVPAAPSVTTTTQSRTLYLEEAEEHIPFYRSTALLGSLGVALLLACVAGWLAWQRYQDRVGGPPVQVVLAEPDGSTGDAVLDRTLVAVFRSELAQSPFVTILPGGVVREKLQQMQHKQDEPLTPALALEVCERSGSQAVIRGSVAKAGNHFVVAEQAINCADGSSLGEVSREASKAEGLPATLMKLAATIRHDLGESRRTIARFSHPLAPVTTGSLGALKDLTEAERLMALGRGPEAVDLLKQSVALDPTFAGGWLDLSTDALNNRQRKEGEVYLTNAWNLREFATEPTRRLITARYAGEVTGDLYESLRNYQTWVDEYPRNAVPWSGMSVVDHDMGRVADELNAAQHLFAINQSFQQIYYALGMAQERSGDFTAARGTLQAAVVKGLDGDTIRQELLKVAHILHDSQLIAEQEVWAAEHPVSPYLLSHMAYYAELEGRSEEADRLLARALEACRHMGNTALYNDMLTELLTDRAGLGKQESAKALLARMDHPDPTGAPYLLALEYAGEGGAVEPLLKAQIEQHPRSTRWNDIDGPLLRGKLLLDAGKPREALEALAPVQALGGVFTDVAYLRGLADLQLRQLPQAEGEFRFILDHPGIDPAAWQRPAAVLQLARTLAREGRKQEAVQCYQAFLAAMAHADPGQPLIQIAKDELSSTKP